LALVGCSPSTTMEVRGVSRDKAAFALWKHRPVVASPNDFDNPIKVIKYSGLGNPFDILSNTTYMKDTVYIKERDPNDIVISLKCESKTVPFINFFGELLIPYERDINKERLIMIETAEELYPLNVSIKWKGQWRKFIPVERTEFGNSIWFAYEANSVDLILKYFYSHGYKESHDNTIQDWIFTRHLTSEPDDWSKSKRKTSGWEWESYEKIIVQKIIVGGGRFIIAIGIAASGVQVNPIFIDVKKHYDIGEELRNKLLDNLTKLLEENSETTTFVSPSIYIERVQRQLKVEYPSLFLKNSGS
jgi:hypothetical protein